MEDQPETYRQLNQDLIQQVQEYKRRQRLFEMKDLQMMQESLILRRIIREHKALIESFVVQNSQDLNILLNQMSDGNEEGMSVVTEFVKRMSINLQNLLLNISTDDNSLAEKKRSFGSQPKRAAQVKTDETQKVVSESREKQEDDAEPPVDCYITKRRRGNISPRNFTHIETDETEPTPEPECDPKTLSNGMLSTIPENPMDGNCDQILITTTQEDDGEEKRDVIDQPAEVVSDKENVVYSGKISIMMDSEDVATATANPRKRMYASRSVLSPVDTNPTETRIKRSRTPIPKKRSEQLLEQEITTETVMARPRRKAAPQVLTEPAINRKMRQ